jgi:Ferritin-like domain
MTKLITPETGIVAERRTFLRTTGAATLSATAVALIVGCESMAAQGTASNPSNDVATLNVALGLEHEAIIAYQLGAESKLLQPAVLQPAVLFQDHHKQHRDALIATIRKLGGTPVAEKSKDEYARALNAGAIKSQADILRLAQRLERGAANAYLGVIPSFKDSGLAQVAGRLAADETMHYTALTTAMAEMLPQKALSFGA